MKDSRKSARDELELWERGLGQRIREERQRLGLSQAEVAGRMSERGFGMIQTTIAKIEAGSRPLRVSEFVGIAQALGMTWHSLLATADSMLPLGDPHIPFENDINLFITQEGAFTLDFGEEVADFTRKLEAITLAYADVRVTREAMARRGREARARESGEAPSPQKRGKE